MPPPEQGLQKVMERSEVSTSMVPYNFRSPSSNRFDIQRGFTLIELMIVVAIIAIILTLALPVYTNYTVRAKVGEALAVGASAKTATTDTCMTDPDIATLTNARAGYQLESSPYIDSIVISGPCSQPVITMTTQNTGATVDPVLILTGSGEVGDGRIAWTCTEANGQNIFVPRTCRS